MKILMGILTLIGAATLFHQLGALTQGTAHPVILALAALVSVITITYWENERRKA